MGGGVIKNWNGAGRQRALGDTNKLILDWGRGY